MLLLDGYESHLSTPVLKYAQEEKILLVCLPSHASHLLQPLDVGLFGPLQHYYGLEVDRLAQLGVTHISKTRFLEILTPARLAAYTTKNVVSAWKEAGIEPYNPAPVLDRMPAARPTTPPSAPPRSAVPRTPRTVVQVDGLLDHLLEGMERTPSTLRVVEKLAKGCKRSFAEIQLQAAREKDLLEVNAQRKTRKRKLTTKNGLFLTPDVANSLRRDREASDTKVGKERRIRQARAERLADLQRGGILVRRKRLPKGRLVVLPVVLPGTQSQLAANSSSEESTDSEEGLLEVANA